jgi:hypothetical protein
MKRTVFVSGSIETLPLMDSLRAELEGDARVLTWTDAPFSLAQPALAQLSQSAVAADFAVIILSVDDTIQTHVGETTARDNLLFELGFLVGAIGSERVLIVDASPREPSIKLPTDLTGFTLLRARPSRNLQPRPVARMIVDEVRRRTRHVEPRPQAEPTPAYSCFISYSHEDEILAKRLYEDLRDVGERCWMNRHELRVGDSIPDQITAALLATDKFLPILSRNAIRSPWFGRELEKALELERKRSSTVLIPIRIDDAVLSIPEHPWVDLRDR